MTKLNYKHSTTICSETRVNVGENILKSQDTSNTHNTRLQHKLTSATQAAAKCFRKDHPEPNKQKTGERNKPIITLI